jgi:hypothetical protein
MNRERMDHFFNNMASALGLCILEEVDVLESVIPALVCMGILWFVGSLVYDLVLDPHVTTAAALDSISINPDKWIPR